MELYSAIPFSYGTLGFLTAVDLVRSGIDGTALDILVWRQIVDGCYQISYLQARLMGVLWGATKTHLSLLTHLFALCSMCSLPE
jgi:hypothetical protein